MPLAAFHPAVARWFAEAFPGGPTLPQVQAWPEIRAGRPTLIAAPTGSGKTLAAFLASIDELCSSGELADQTAVVYISPLKALSNDIRKNLEEPLLGIAAAAAELGIAVPEIRTAVRTGDTPARERTGMVKRPPHILVTTPESLYILLTSAGGRRLLGTARTVIVDEIHAVVADKRGAHLALSLERLAALCVKTSGRAPQRIGLSATQKPIAEVARFLVGAGAAAAAAAIIDVGHRRALDLGIEIPGSPLEAVMSAEVWEEIYERLETLVREHRSTLVFVNTRRQSERVAHQLTQRLGAEQVAAHHGSLSRERRLDAETRLKNGELRVLVATASLELGIDIGAVDLVCQLGSTRAISSLLQRVGRSGHRLGDLPKGRLFPLSRDELIECVALCDAVRRGDLEELSIPEQPLDILAQQIVAEVGAEDWLEDELYASFRQAWPYRNLGREEFAEVAAMLGEGFSTRRGRRSAYLHRDRVHGWLRARRGARLAAITSGGAIPDAGDFQVLQEPASTLVGTVNEDFAIESLPGDVFQLGNTSWRISKVEPGRVFVEDARGAPPSLPFWLGESPERSAELSRSVCALRVEVSQRLATARERSPEQAVLSPEGRRSVALEFAADRELPLPAAEQIIEYLAATEAALGVMPTQRTLVLERFFDEAGDTHVVLHAPFGSRINRAWGLALRKRFCRAFNFELQAAATEDAILFSLGPTHSFPLAEVFGFLNAASVRQVLVQAMLDAPVFGVRWRWNASRALALLRFRGGRRVPPRLQRQQADDLSAVIFPDHLACPENLGGERQVPDHPLVRQTVHDCLTEAMDVAGLEELLRSIAAGERELIARELTEPSPLAHEVVNARVYSFLDDAPLEERRTQAVQARRFLSPEDAARLGELDLAAIDAVRAESWPLVENAEELHDALLVHGFLTASEIARYGDAAATWLAELESSGRVLRAAGEPVLWYAAERSAQLGALVPQAPVAPALAREAPDAAAALIEIVRARLELLGPVTVAELGTPLVPVTNGSLESALAALEGEGFVFRGRFTPAVAETEWCARALLARIHRRTLDRLRREIEPVAKADFVRFLADWHHATAEVRASGPEGLAGILDQLEGFEAPAAAWESEILPARVGRYDSAWLDALCQAGRYVWLRLSVPPLAWRTVGEEEGAGVGRARRGGPVRGTPIALVRRENVGLWRRVAFGSGRGGAGAAPVLSADAAAVVDRLATRGASFFAEIAASTRLLPTQLEAALAELVAWGLVTSDSFAGLRALLAPARRRAALAAAQSPRMARMGLVPRLDSRQGMDGAGRWSLLEAAPALPSDGAGPLEAWRQAEDDAEAVARTLLRRYGVVSRRLVDGEGQLPPWRNVLAVLRRLEARGEVRGGRFVDGLSGEQYALPAAVARLRTIRRSERGGALLAVAAVDPLGLPGLLPVEARVPALVANRLLYRDGEALAALEAGASRFLVDLEPAAAWEAETVLRRRGAGAASDRLKRSA